MKAQGFLRALIAAFLLILAAPAFAQQAGAGAGYVYPRSSGGVTCSPGCDGVSVSFIVPTPVYVGTNGEAQNSSFIYVGIFGGTGHGAQCTLGSGNNNPLLQFGITGFILSDNAISYDTWWEAYPCNNVQSFGSLVINAGDTMTLELLCTANCTSGDQTASWRMTWTNVTTGLSQSRTDTNNWKVYTDFAQVAVELTQTAVNSASNQPLNFTTPIKFFNAQVHQGGVWGPMAVPGESPPSRSQQDAKQLRCLPTPPNNCGTSASVYQTYGPSTTIDSDNGPSWLICSTVATTTSSAAPPCPYSNYNSTIGVSSVQ